MAEFVPLEQLYTRALTILGVVTPGARQTSLSLAVSPVSIISDVSDASVPHQNPLFGVSITTTAVAAEFSIVQLIAINRMIRLRQLNIVALGTSPRIELLSVAAAAMATIQVAATPGFSMSPSVIPGLGNARGGVNAGAPLLDANAYRPSLGTIDFRPALLIAAGEALCYEDQSSNTQISISLIYEEIPLQTDIANLGFPA